MASASHVTIRKRVAILFVFIVLIMVGLTCRLAFLQFYRSSWLAENAADQRIRQIPVEAKRGIIYDRNMKELAVSVSTESVYAIPAEIRDIRETAAKLAAILALDEDKLVVKLQKRQAFTWIKRKIDEDKAREIKLLNLSGIGLTQEGTRIYPHEHLAAHLLGFTGIDSQGLDGVELTFDSYLKGRQGSIIVEYDARGREIPYASHRFLAPIEGNNIYLTIDLIIQEIVERELDKVMQETQAKAGTIIVMQPQTGEILALANRPTYNPNKFADYAPQFWRNIAISNTYEPGSTFKVITAAAALNEKTVRLADRFFDSGEIEVQGRHIHCWKHGGHGSQSFEEVVMNSCNVGFVTVGLRLGRDPMYNYFENFGLGKQTNIDLPGEAKGILINRAQVKPINIATMSMGQSIAVTPMQLITAVSAAVNGGTLLRPQIVREARDKNGQVIREFQPDVLNQVLTPATSSELRGILEKVVEKGTGKNAYIEGYKVGGKTGTAQKVGSGGYMPGKYIASFVGFSPADNPKVVMLVVIDEPVGMYYGGQIATPVFLAVMKDVLPYLKIIPSLNQLPNKEQQDQHATVPNIINFSLSDAAAELQKVGLRARIEESGDRVADQIPKPGSRIAQGSTVLLFTESSRYLTDEITVPDCKGKTVHDIVREFAEFGLKIRTVGEGTAVGSDPPAGTLVLPGATITVNFE